MKREYKDKLILPDGMAVVLAVQQNLNYFLPLEVEIHRLQLGILNNFPLFVKLGQLRPRDDERQRPEPQLGMPGFHYMLAFLDHNSTFHDLIGSHGKMFLLNHFCL